MINSIKYKGHPKSETIECADDRKDAELIKELFYEMYDIMVGLG